jgi:hypothetical protein
MPANMECNKATMTPKISDLKKLHDLQKPSFLSSALRRKLIGSSCPELYMSPLSSDLKLDPGAATVKEPPNEKTGRNNRINFGRNRFYGSSENNARFQMERIYRVFGFAGNCTFAPTQTSRTILYVLLISFRVRTEILKMFAGKDLTIWGIHIDRKSTHEVVKKLHGALYELEAGLEMHEKIQKRITKNLEYVRRSICSDASRGDSANGGLNNHRVNSRDCNAMMSKLISSGCMGCLIRTLPRMEFEDRKVVCLLFCNIMRRQSASNSVIVNYLEDNKDLLFALLSG